MGLVCNAGFTVSPMCEECDSLEEDTANEIGSLLDCLFSTRQRTQVAIELITSGKTDCLPTILEDIAVGVQHMTDAYMIVKEGSVSES